VIAIHLTKLEGPDAEELEQQLLPSAHLLGGRNAGRTPALRP